jgi:intracellular septation protein
MQALYDFFPIFIFGIVYYFGGIYAATLSLIITTTIQVIYHRYRFKKFSSVQVITMALVWVLGGATLVFHNVLFIKWKPSVIYILFAIILLACEFFSKKSPLKHMLGTQLSLPDLVWKKLSIVWAIFFIVMAILNLWVAYHFSTKEWVYFKVIGCLVLTVLFLIAQSFYIAPYLKEKPHE